MEMERPITPLLPDNKHEALEEPLDIERELAAILGSDPSGEFPVPTLPGLQNVGNTCFLNAVLQCVSHTVPLVQGLRASAHRSPCDVKLGVVAGAEGMFCSICALRQHLETCFNDMGGVVIPGGFVTNLNNMSSSFNRNRQEDAHEFLHCLLDNIHTSCLDPKFRCGPSLLQQDSFIKQIFGGRLRSQVKCCDCGHVSTTFEPLLDLSLEIEDAETLEEALASFTRVEKIEDPEIKFSCDSCNARVSVQKQFTLDQAPSVVAIHLKRFTSDGYLANKIDTFVRYPMNLDLKPFLSSPNDTDVLTYELYAVLVHDGRYSFFGHYYCFIRSSPNVWHAMDDEIVMRSNENQALEQKAYILFYMKQGTPWFSSLIGQRIRVKEDNINEASPPCSPLLVEKSACAISDNEDYLKAIMDTVNGDDILKLSDGASLDEHWSQAGKTNCENLTRIPRIYEKMKPSSNASSVTCIIDDEKDYASCRFQSGMNKVSVAETTQSDSATDRGTAASCGPTPGQLSTNRSYNETWVHEDEQENSPEVHSSDGVREHAKKPNDKEQSATLSYSTFMSSARRDCYEQPMGPPMESPNAGHRRQKRKQSLDPRNVHCKASSMASMRQVTYNLTSALHKPPDDSQVDFGVDCDHSDKRGGEILSLDLAPIHVTGAEPVRGGGRPITVSPRRADLSIIGHRGPFHFVGVHRQPARVYLQPSFCSSSLFSLSPVQIT